MNRPATVFLGVIAVGFLSQTVNATPIISQDDNITISGGSLVLRAPKSDLPGNHDYGDDHVFTYIQNDVNLYNAPISGHKLTTPLPTPTAKDVSGTPLLKNDASGNSIDLTLGGYDYLFLHWGGHGGGWEQVYYVGGLTGLYEFDKPTKAGDNSDTIGGLSFYSFYGPSTNVPDGGMTVLLLGAALSGLGLARRKLS